MKEKESNCSNLFIYCDLSYSSSLNWDCKLLFGFFFFWRNIRTIFYNQVTFRWFTWRSSTEKNKYEKEKAAGGPQWSVQTINKAPLFIRKINKFLIFHFQKFFFSKKKRKEKKKCMLRVRASLDGYTRKAGPII